MPALPIDDAGRYVAAAYMVFVTLVVVYVLIIAAKVRRMKRELVTLVGTAPERRR